MPIVCEFNQPQFNPTKKESDQQELTPSPSIGGDNGFEPMELRLLELIEV